MEKAIIRSFGRIHGKKLSARQQWLVQNLLPSIAPSPLPPDCKTILEIGFGAGEHLMELSLAHPDKIIIGAEPFVNGVASLLSHITIIENEKLKIENYSDLIKSEFKNIRIWADDVRKILNSQFSIINSFAEIWILHPDPWPKSRHEKRRLLSAEFLNLLAGYLEQDGKIIIGTDHLAHYDWILEQVKQTKLGVRSEELGVIETRYQKKDKFGAKTTKYLVLTKL